MLKTIYVTRDAAWVRKDGANLVVEVEGEEIGRAPLHMLGGLVTFGRPGLSPALMAACAEAGIAMSCLDPNGRFLARIEGARGGNVLLRRAQYRLADDEARIVPVVLARQSIGWDYTASPSPPCSQHTDHLAPSTPLAMLTASRLRVAPRPSGWPVGQGFDFRCAAQ